MALGGLAGVVNDVRVALTDATTRSVGTRRLLGAVAIAAGGGPPAAPGTLFARLLGAPWRLRRLAEASARLDLAQAGALFFGGTLAVSASAQENRGTALASDAVDGFTVGTHTIRLARGGATADLQIAVHEGDTNATVLRGFADAVRATGLRIDADVETDDTAGTSRLVLTAEDAGTAGAFRVAGFGGSAVGVAGVGTASTLAADATYVRGGVPLAPDGFAGSVGVLLTPPRDGAGRGEPAALRAAIETLLDAFDDARRHLEASGDPAAAALEAIALRQAAALESIGIVADRDGRLSVDAARLDEVLATQPATVERTLGASGGFARALYRLAEARLAYPPRQLADRPPVPASYGPALLGGNPRGIGATRLAGLLVDQLG